MKLPVRYIFTSVFEHLTCGGVAGRWLVCKRGGHVTGTPKATVFRLLYNVELYK